MDSKQLWWFLSYIQILQFFCFKMLRLGSLQLILTQCLVLHKKDIWWKHVFKCLGQTRNHNAYQDLNLRWHHLVNHKFLICLLTACLFVWSIFYKMADLLKLNHLLFWSSVKLTAEFKIISTVNRNRKSATTFAWLTVKLLYTHYHLHI